MSPAGWAVLVRHRVLATLRVTSSGLNWPSGPSVTVSMRTSRWYLGTRVPLQWTSGMWVGDSRRSAFQLFSEAPDCAPAPIFQPFNPSRFTATYIVQYVRIPPEAFSSFHVGVLLHLQKSDVYSPTSFLAQPWLEQSIWQSLLLFSLYSVTRKDASRCYN